MASIEIKNIAKGLNANGTEQFSSTNLSNIVRKIGQGRKNILNIVENVAMGFAWLQLFNPEHKIDLSFVEENPDIKHAISIAYPNVDLSKVEYESEEEISGFINGVKGKLFEIKVADKLNSGERVGEIELEPGQFVKLADSPTQEGYDLVLVDVDGSIQDFYQLKATDSIEYVKSTISGNPNIHIISTSEVAEELDNQHVSDSEISNSELEVELTDLEDLDFLGDIPIVGGVMAVGAFAKGDMEGGVNYLINRVGATAGGTLVAAAGAFIGLGGFILPVIGIVGSYLTSKFMKNTIKISLRSEEDNKTLNDIKKIDRT